ncbi:unnamed protein product [Candidula unifasciata]|uniref:Uncharacterized protein n=1 Tax=Candidula unifasciata TaxID=100452 RepID=A0A8S3Z1V6_9EUPU|nr:unnamed protein product [Candidula unifasciata]
MGVQDKKTRKPLVQGRLLADTTTFDSKGEFQDDPTMLPAKSLPVLTESVSSRPEPLQCLDLSDTETDVTYGARAGSVVVFDASALGDPSSGAAVDVVLAYEHSPARIICHTPGKLQHSLRHERATDVSALCAGDGPSISVTVDRVLTVAGSTAKTEHYQSLLDDQENLNKVGSFRGNRGIIEEILMQELGSSNVEAISLHSETSPLAAQQPTTGALLPNSQQQPNNKKILDFLSTNVSHNGDPSLNNSVFTRSSQDQHRKHKMCADNQTPFFPQPKFDDSDTSVDQIPVKDSIQNQQAKLHDDSSGSETCSLHEYVTPHKLHNKAVSLSKLELSAKPVPDTEPAPALASTKKRKLRKVTSRYLLSSVSRNTAENKLASKSSSMEASVLKSHSRSQTSASAVGKQTREKQHVDMKAELRTRKAASGRSTRTNNMPTKSTNTQTLQSPDSPQEAIRSSHEFPNTKQKTSTPTHDQTCHLSSQDIDASAIHSVSAVSINTTVPSFYPAAAANKAATDTGAKNLMTQTVSNKRNAHRPSADPTSSTSDTSQLQLDLEHTRYLQWAFMNSKVSKLLQEQEKDAAAHLHALWKVVESRREDNVRLQMDVARLQQINLLETVLDKTEPDLDTVVSLLPQLEEYYCRMSSALDTTRHQLPTRNIYIPQGSAELQEEYEDKLEAALTESEQLLTELDELTGDKVLPLGHYLDCVEAIQKNVMSTFSELQGSQVDVDVLKGLSTRLTSLSIQEMQL